METVDSWKNDVMGVIDSIANDDYMDLLSLYSEITISEDIEEIMSLYSF